MPVAGTSNAGTSTTRSGLPNAHSAHCFLYSASGIRTFAARRAGFDPVDQLLCFFDRQAARVLEHADVRVRMPRRHALRADDFANHRREARDDVVVRHRKRADAAGAMAGHAVVDQHRGDLLGVGDSLARREPVFATLTEQPLAATFAFLTGWPASTESSAPVAGDCPYVLATGPR